MNESNVRRWKKRLVYIGCLGVVGGGGGGGEEGGGGGGVWGGGGGEKPTLWMKRSLRCLDFDSSLAWRGDGHVPIKSSR